MKKSIISFRLKVNGCDIKHASRSIESSTGSNLKILSISVWWFHQVVFKVITFYSTIIIAISYFLKPDNVRMDNENRTDRSRCLTCRIFHAKFYSILDDWNTKSAHWKHEQATKINFISVIHVCIQTYFFRWREKNRKKLHCLWEYIKNSHHVSCLWACKTLGFVCETIFSFTKKRAF